MTDAMIETVDTVDRFCRDLLDEHHEGQRHDPETIAARFVERFHLSARPDLAELRALLKEAGVGEVSELAIDGAPKGLHVGVLGQECHIFYKEELWQGARDYTVLHETYEIMHETLCDLATGTQPVEEVCRQADRFAAGVLMQPGEFRTLALASGLDVMALQREYGYAYAAVTMRLAEVVRGLPYFVVLYQRPGRVDPANWPKGDDLALLRATVVRRTQGMGPPASSLVMGIRGSIPRRHRRVPAGSLAELAARTGRPEYAEADGLAAVAQPVHWKGRLAKLAVVAVPLTHRDALAPQLGSRREPSRQLPARPRLAAS